MAAELMKLEPKPTVSGYLANPPTAGTRPRNPDR
jgi:hypothetical protein